MIDADTTQRSARPPGASGAGAGAREPGPAGRSAPAATGSTAVITDDAALVSSWYQDWLRRPACGDPGARYRVGHAGSVMDPLPHLEDLAALFESEPVHPFGVAGSPWPYALVRFSLERGAMRVDVEIDPASDQVGVVLSSAGEQVVDLELHAVRAVVVERRRGVELLGVIFDERLRADGLWLRTAPQISLTWRAGADD